MFKKASILLLSLTLASSMFLVGCGKNKNSGDTNKTSSNASEANPAKERENVLTFATTSLDGAFNPIMWDNVYDRYVVHLVFSPLVNHDAKGKVVPAVAKSWDISDDKLTYTFHLNEGIKFHDGKELTAEDVEFTYYKLSSSDYTGSRGNLVSDIVGAKEYRDNENVKTIEGIKVIDKYTISFKVKSPNIKKIWDFECGILPKHYYDVDNWDKFLALNQKPMGSGPMKYSDYAVSQYLQLDSFDDYFKGRAKIDGVIIKLTPVETSISEVAIGNIDLTSPSANQKNIDMMTENGFVGIDEFATNGYNYLGFNLRLKKFQDKKVRQALAYGLNRKAFIESQWEGHATVCNTPLSTVSWAYTDDLNNYDYNAEKAKQLLKEAGWVDRDNNGWVENEAGEEFTIVWTAYNDVDWPLNLIAVAKENWKQIGVHLDSKLMEFNAVSDLVYKDQDFQVYNMAWTLDIDPDPTKTFGSKSDVQGGWNSVGFHNDRADEIFKLGLQEYDQQKRKALYQEWAKLANEELPYIFVAYRNEIWGVNERVKNLEMGPYAEWTLNITDIELEK